MKIFNIEAYKPKGLKTRITAKHFLEANKPFSLRSIYELYGTYELFLFMVNEPNSLYIKDLQKLSFKIGYEALRRVKACDEYYPLLKYKMDSFKPLLDKEQLTKGDIIDIRETALMAPNFCIRLLDLIIAVILTLDQKRQMSIDEVFRQAKLFDKDFYLWALKALEFYIGD